MVEIDGSYLEGGGQILRTACALSVITKKPCRIFNIRQNRPKPGLAVQHLLGVQSLARLCQAKLSGDYLGSTEIALSPDKISENRIVVNIPTAASIVLILQGLVLPALFAKEPVKIIFEGGATNTFFSPPIDYFQYVFLRTLEKMGVKVEINAIKQGYYPEGGANVQVKVFPSKLKKINSIERGNFKKILAISGASELLKEKKVAERQLMGAKEILGKLNLPVEEKVEYFPSQCPGSQICLIAEFENTVIGTDGLGKLGKRAEDVGKEAALELLKEQKNQACLDKYLADQLIPYLALSGDKSSVTASEITEHCQANIWLTEKFLAGNFNIKNNLILWMPS